ncbi:hypothetical protein Poli38472_004533 [Pythium oligandrum]|uniref:Trehalose-phosphatase n=1 Tax=Pythium oligandrum TaxID=41045 RepID=A0A8K1CAH6_PYTOL|nr:hypothetical protein Poli38472_004533 [Pythium oligandrum]|eukprot:TMW59464.1 hypothetical protein Poli38472_004533 [Pythium oligandrum]
MLQRLRHVVGWGLPPQPSGSRIDFQVCAELGHGQTLYIVGDIPALGGSIDAVPNPAAASNSSSSTTTSSSEPGLALVTTPDLYPIWYNLEPVIVPVGSVIRYRYAVCSGSKFMRYERLTVQCREIIVGMEDMQMQDTLDSLSPPSGDVWGFVPRLSSGQAFMDRRASGGSGSGDSAEGSTSGGSWFKRITKPRFSQSITESIPEEEGADVVMQEAENEDGEEKEGEHESMYEPNTLVASVRSPSSYGSLHRHQSAPPLSMSLKDQLNANVDEDARLLCSSPVLNRARTFSDDSVKSPQNVTIESTDGVIIVVYRLPVLVQRTPEGEYHIEWEDDNLLCPSGLLKESTQHAGGWDRVNSMRLTWVGTVHCSSAIPKEDEDRLARQLEAFHCVPVFLNQPLAQTFHDFCYGTLWPVFHNIVDVYGRLPTRWWNPNQQKNAWSSYKNVNRIFVNKVIEVYNDGDLVWVQGLHLLVAPSFLSRRLPSVNVGLFLHTPFPSSEIFRTLSVRADLLRGMLSADHIGFHLYEHARHFLTSCRRVLGLKYSAQPGGYIGIEYSGRMVMLTISHIGIEPAFMDTVNQSVDVRKDTKELREKYESHKHTVIVSVDRVERLKGILLKFGAIEHFLLLHPEWQSKLQVVQVGLVDSSNPSEEKTRLLNEIAAAVKRINERFAVGRKQPVISYTEVENTDMASRLPLWKLGHIMLTTSVRDAVNLYPFEFVYAHELSKTAGVVIVSEFSGSSRVLTGSIGINPWKRDEIVKALLLAVSMSDDERRARHRKDLAYINNNSRTKWAERILVDLKRTKKYATEGEHMGYGLGLGFRMLEFNAGFKLLDTEAVARAYRTSFRRVLLFDYGSTLTAESTGKNDFSKYLNGSELSTSDSTMVPRADAPAASPELISALSLLCADPRNTVFVLSGRERSDLEKTLGSVKGLGLAAEHGYLYKWGDNRSGDGEDVWLCTKDNFDDSWKDITHSVMDTYTQRTHGTYVELKGSSMLWQYRDADPEFSQLQAKELHDQLTQVLENFQVEVLTGNDYLEVRPEGVDKGVVVDRILSTLESTGSGYVDFVLCVGDDLSDEFMFQYLEEARSRPKLFTVTVGKKPSAAKYFVNDVEQVMEVLHSLTKVSTAANRNLSMNDLRLLDHHSRQSPGDLFNSARPPLPPLSLRSGITFDRQPSGTPQVPYNNCLTPTATSTRASLSEESSGTDMGLGLGLGGGGLGLRSKNSMSMSALSSVATTFVAPVSTYEQYVNNIDESEEDDGGIFF